MRDEVLPAIIKRPVRSDSRRANNQDNCCNRYREFPDWRTLRDSPLNHPSNAKASGNRDRNKCRQIVRIFVLGNFVADGVSQISDHDSQKKPESRTVSLESVNATRESQNERQRKPRKAELAQCHSAEFSKLCSYYLRLKGEIDLILPARDVPPYFLQRTRMAPVDDRRVGGCKWQVSINRNESAK